MSAPKGQMHWLDYKSHTPDASYCQLKVKNDLAYLRFSLTTPKVEQIVKTRRVSFTDMLGTLGEQYTITVYTQYGL